jgi:hypothetical protein
LGFDFEFWILVIVLGFRIWVSFGFQDMDQFGFKGLGFWILILLTDFCNEIIDFAYQAWHNITREEKISLYCK